MSLTPTQLQDYLLRLIQKQLKLAVMIWGPPGIGKSSIVAQIAKQQGLDFVDVRLSQLAPTDLRGLPVPHTDSHGKGISQWYPPEFLPQSGQGILFLDEVNMAPPTMQGMAQQLILDRQVGSYHLPEGWFVWAAGNRKEDRASVFDMPAPLANRFVHLSTSADFYSWRTYALKNGLHDHILAFLSYRPELLHSPDKHSAAWPSPRSWEMASQLYRAQLDVSPAIGDNAGGEFAAFVQLFEKLPDLGDILSGHHKKMAQPPTLPAEPSVRYAAVVGLAARAQQSSEALEAFSWLSEQAGPEWMQLFVSTLVAKFQALGQLSIFQELLQKDSQLSASLQEALQLSEG